MALKHARRARPEQGHDVSLRAAKKHSRSFYCLAGRPGLFGYSGQAPYSSSTLYQARRPLVGIPSYPSSLPLRIHTHSCSSDPSATACLTACLLSTTRLHHTLFNRAYPKHPLRRLITPSTTTTFVPFAFLSAIIANRPTRPPLTSCINQIVSLSQSWWWCQSWT
jgi:hypothetical protein